jgi:hypothetical membrane protein
MKNIGRPAVIAAFIGPVQSVLGWTIAGALWAGYDPIKQTISELAAPESPVKEIMSSFFIFGGTLTLIVSIFSRTFSMPGRVALFLTAIATYGLTIFPTPLIGYSIWHRIFAISSFVLSAGWPLAAMRLRKDAPAILRPFASITATALQAALAIAFLIVWVREPIDPFTGVWERVVAVSQSLYISVVVLAVYFSQRKVANTHAK